MENPERSLDKRLTAEKELVYFKAAIRSVMIAASKVPINIELLYDRAKLEEQIALLDHYLDYTRRLCEKDITEVGNQEMEHTSP